MSIVRSRPYVIDRCQTTRGELQLQRGGGDYEIISNGPDWTVSDENRALYGCGGLAMVQQHLAPGGALSVWSATASPAFGERLCHLFGNVRVLPVGQGRGGPDYVYLATHAAPAAAEEPR
jgi:hypothetical protein